MHMHATSTTNLFCSLRKLGLKMLLLFPCLSYWFATIEALISFNISAIRFLRHAPNFLFFSQRRDISHPISHQLDRYNVVERAAFTYSCPHSKTRDCLRKRSVPGNNDNKLRSIWTLVAWERMAKPYTRLLYGKWREARRRLSSWCFL
jgi:hypothetical protein